MDFISAVVNRYKSEKCIVSYQLENEALLTAFGKRSEVDRTRLRAEYKLVKSLDPNRPIIMTTSTSWGIPARNPIPDIVGFSYYQVHFNPTKTHLQHCFSHPTPTKVQSWTSQVSTR
jgi:endo-1,4-beta-mannosidase